MKKFLISLAIIAVLLTAPFSASALRLDQHSAMMTYNSGAYMAYSTSSLSTKLNHYVCGGSANGNGVGDWINITGSTSSATECTYPITVLVTVDSDKGKITTDHWFQHNDIQYYADGGAGASSGPVFSYNWNQNQWYNYLPSSISYNDDHPDNDPRIYVANNASIYWGSANGNGNQVLYSGGTPIMYPDYVACFPYMNNNDYTNADWHWYRASQGWSTAGLVQGTNTVYFVGSDASANFTYGSAQFLYDTGAPTYQGMSVNGAQYYDGSSYWVKGGTQTNITFDCNDSVSKPAQTYLRAYSWDGVADSRRELYWNNGGASSEYYMTSSDVNINWGNENGSANSGAYVSSNYGVLFSNTERDYSIMDDGMDYAGNEYNNWAFSRINMRVDSTPPTVPSISTTDNLTNVVFSIGGSTDSRSGLSYYQYNMDNAGWSNYGTPVTVTSYGTHTVQVRAVDHVGNVSGTSSKTFTVDGIPPVVSITVSPSSPDGNNGWYRTQTAPVVTFHAADYESGLASVYYTVSGDDNKSNVPTTNGGTYTLPHEGTYRFTLKATDRAGNTATTGVTTVKWDKTAPSGNVVFNYGFNDHLSLLVNNVIDTGGSGINSLKVNLTDVDNASNKLSLPLSQSAAGTWILNDTDILSSFAESYQVNAEVWADDVAGNSARLNQQTLDLLQISADVQPNPAKQGQQITYTINTSGNPNKLIIDLPSDIYNLDTGNANIVNGSITIPIVKQETLTTPYPYTLPLKTPLTLDPSGNRLLQPYSFTITAVKSSGKMKSCNVTLDVQNNIFSGLRTRFRN